MSDYLECVICESVIPDLGHNPDPVNNGKGRCCDLCNITVVIPARLKQIRELYE